MEELTKYLSKYRRKVYRFGFVEVLIIIRGQFHL